MEALMPTYGFEIDYLPVGNGKKSGDAIIVKFGNLHTGRREDFMVFVIDGGTFEAGQSIVNHLWQYTGSNYINLVLATHPDNDHVSGIETVLLNCNVGALAMHMPWVIDRRFGLINSLGRAQEIHDIAVRKGVTLYDPLFVTSYFSGALRILGPSVDYYSSLIGEFDRPKKQLGAGEISNKALIRETADFATETLDQAHKYVSPTNNSSVIAYFNYAGKDALFTGDAGPEALVKAIVTANAQGINASNMHFLHVPHHGSQHNLTTELINFFNPTHAYVSASSLAKKHPHPRVVNAFHRRGLNIFSTSGQALCHRFNTPARAGWPDAILAPFVHEFEVAHA
jgi:beta-lactamase superfamily II metal-dependent hydrolase